MMKITFEVDTENDSDIIQMINILRQLRGSKQPTISSEDAKIRSQKALAARREKGQIK